MNNGKTMLGSVVRMLLCAAFCTLHASLFTACSESEDEEANEFANWQTRNEVYWASLADSLSRDPASWTKIKSFTKDEQVAGASTDYIYVKQLATGSGDSPLYTDSVRLAYSGRLIPSATYTQGYNFDYTYLGTYSEQTTAVNNGVCSAYIDGFTTALLHMRRGDVWRVYIPHTLGYGTTASGSIPAYSVLVFDLALIDFHAPGDDWFPVWN